MPSRKKVQNTHICAQLRAASRGACWTSSAIMNRPQRDEALIKAAGIPLDRALFPLLVGIERFGPIGVVELADRVGRDYTTVSRQVAKLESLGLVERRPNPADRRVREAVRHREGQGDDRSRRRRARQDRSRDLRDLGAPAISPNWCA